MNIIYIITIVVLYTLFMLIHKTEKKQNIIMWLAISSIIIMCYNILICVLYTFIGILCTLFNLSICNAIVSVILLGVVLKTKKTQKYYFKISDLIFSIILFGIVVFVAYKQYGPEFNVKYYVTDGSSHYFFAQQFYENSTLLDEKTIDEPYGIYNSEFRLPGAYINEGILFKIFDKILLKTDIFILFDLAILYLSGILFYHLLNTYSNGNKKLYILAVVLSIGYMMSYQLSSMIYGFVYLSFALDIIIALLLLIKVRKKEKIGDTIILPVLFLISFGIFFSYAYFIPVIYISIIINIIITSIRNKQKILSSSNIVEMLYLIIIPAILGIFYFIVLPLLSGYDTEISAIGEEGAIYRNYITNFLILIPIYIISIAIFIKNKQKLKNEYFHIILFAMSIIFAVILFIGKKKYIVSGYYCFKAYFLIWILAIYNFYICMVYLNENLKKTRNIIHIYVMFCILIIMIFTIIIPKSIGINNIFYNNHEKIKQQWFLAKKGEMKLMNKLEDLGIKDDTYVWIDGTSRGRIVWMSILHHNPLIYYDHYTTYQKVSIEKWLSEKEERYYLAYYEEYNRLETSEKTLNENNDKYKIIHNDEYGFVLERK